MTYNLQIYRAVFLAFTTFDGGLRVRDVIQPNRFMVKLGWMPDEINEVLNTMVGEGLLTTNSGETKSSLGSLDNVWCLTSKGFELYSQICS